MTCRPIALALLTLVLAAPAVAQDGRGLDFLFGRIDADGDGEISAAELAAARAQQFARIDADGDARVTLVELTAAQERLARFAALPGAAPAERLQRQDADGDGALTEAEFTAPSPFFVLVDADGNGAISRAEFDRLRAAFSQ